MCLNLSGISRYAWRYVFELSIIHPKLERFFMARPNYTFDKRQKEIAKKKKKEEKRLKKLEQETEEVAAEQPPINELT